MQATQTPRYNVLKLQETHPEECNSTSENVTMFRLWSLLSHNTGIRDLTIGQRSFL